MISNHKNDLKQLVEKQLGGNEDKETTDVKEITVDEELEGEILTSDNYYRVAEKNKTKKKHNLRTLNDSQARAIVSPFVKFIICQFCARIQQGMADTEAKKEQSHVEPPIEVRQEVPNDNATQKEGPIIQESQALPDLQTEKTIFDFFSKSFEPKIENLDGKYNFKTLLGFLIEYFRVPLGTKIS